MASRRNQTLQPRWFHILLALSDEPRHGSGIVDRVLQQTDGGLRLWPAMLYGTLEQLVEVGLIQELTRPEERPPGASGRRRYFRITTTGRERLAEDAERLEALARFARAKAAASNKHTA